VYNRVLVQVSIAADELFDHYQSLSLRHLLAFLQHILKRTLITEFLEEIDVVGRLLDVKQFYNVGVLNGLHDFDLVFERLVELLRVLLDVGSGDGFDGNQAAGPDICALEDLAVGAPPDFLVYVDDKGFHELVVRSSQLGSLLLNLLHLGLVHFRYKLYPTRKKTPKKYQSNDTTPHPSFTHIMPIIDALICIRLQCCLLINLL